MKLHAQKHSRHPIVNILSPQHFDLKTRVARAALFGWSRSRFFGLAPSTAPTPTPTLTLRTVNILFLRDPKYDYDFDDYD